MKQWYNIPVKHQYSLVQALYWMSSCTLGGFAAVYLQYRGLSNTLIGVVVGGGACLSMGMQPLAAQITEEIPFLTVKKMIQLLIICMAGLYAVLTFAPLSVTGVMAVYMMMNTLNSCMPPFLSAMGMEFINRGHYLNFGLSRGLGSICFAFCAAALGFVIEKLYPGILGYIYVVIAALLLTAVSFMEDLGNERKTVKKQIRQNMDVGMFQIAMGDPVFLRLMIGFFLTNISNAAVSTYMVNIVRNLGGTDSTLGIANFVSAASEMPVMLLFGLMMKRSNCLKLLKVSAVFFVIKPMILLSAGNLAAALMGFGLQGLSFGLFTPAAVYYVNNAIPPRMRVKGQAVFSMITSGAAVCGGNLLGGWLQDMFGLRMMLGVCVMTAFAGMLVVVSLPEEREEWLPVLFRMRRWGYQRRQRKKMSRGCC